MERVSIIDGAPPVLDGAPAVLDDAEVSRLLGTLPPPSSSAPHPEVAARFDDYWRATQEGSNFVETLRGRPAFGNPYLLAEVIATFGIDASGSHDVPPEDFFDALANRMRENIEQQRAGGSQLVSAKAAEAVDLAAVSKRPAAAPVGAITTAPVGATTSAAATKKSRFN
jgi:hypothetical protein